MCLDSKYTEQEKEEWLKNQPDVITAYKVVIIEDGKISPVFHRHIDDEGFERNNLLKTVKSKKATRYHEENHYGPEYIAYFHLFASKQDAIEYYDFPPSKVIECIVPKKYITDIGSQDGPEDTGRTVIVTRKFSIVGENEYLD